MYRFIKVKHSIIRTIPILNSCAREFQVSSNKCIRKVLRTSNVESSNLENDIEPGYICQDSSADFLGIESDEGVITLRSSQDSLPQSIQERKSTERFHCTSFGVVRYDTENKLKYHGQYQSLKNFSFPHTKNDFAEVSKDLLKLPNKSVNYSNVFHYNKEMNVSRQPSLLGINKQDESYIDECYFSSVTEKEKTDAIVNSSQSSSEKLSFIDGSYFENLTEKEKADSVVNSSHPTSEDLSFLGESHFKSLTVSEDAKSSEHFAYEDLKSSDKLISEDLKYSDKIEIPFERQHFTETKKVTPLTTQELNVFEENYFKSLTGLETREPGPSQEGSRDLNAEIALGKKELSGAINNESFHPNLKPDISRNLAADSLQNQAPLQEKDDFSKISPHVSNKENILESDIEFNECDGEVSSLYYGQKFKQEIKNDFEYSNTSTLNTNFSSKQKTKAMDNVIKSDIYTVNSAVRKNELKHSSQASEEPDDVSTAQEFVKKLRKEHAISQTNVKKDKSRREVKYDSKGFRILTNQVTDLSFCTRDEIFNLLKNNIVYSDDELLVLNKPYGLVMHDSQTTKVPCLSTFLDDLAKELDPKSTDPKLFTVHRLDKETTGCLLLARNETMASYLKALFAQRKIIKKYWIITTRIPDPPEGIIDIPISEGSINNRKRMVLHPKIPKDLPYRNHSKHGRSAITSYKVILESGNAALVEVFPKTGIKHQIRVHFGFGLSCPILGDHKYSHIDKLAPQKLPSDMLQRLHVRQSKVRHIAMHIHAKSVVIPNYFEDRNLLVNIPLPNHMKENLKRLKFRKRYL